MTSLRTTYPHTTVRSHLVLFYGEGKSRSCYFEDESTPLIRFMFLLKILYERNFILHGTFVFMKTQ